MKTLFRPPLLGCLLAVHGLLPASQLPAAIIFKANNTEALDLASSWDGGVVPGSGDLAAFGSANTADSTPATIGNGVDFFGIILSNSLGANLIINAGSGSWRPLWSIDLGGTPKLLEAPDVLRNFSKWRRCHEVTARLRRLWLRS